MVLIFSIPSRAAEGVERREEAIEVVDQLAGGRARRDLGEPDQVAEQDRDLLDAVGDHVSPPFRRLTIWPGRMLRSSASDRSFSSSSRAR